MKRKVICLLLVFLTLFIALIKPSYAKKINYSNTNSEAVKTIDSFFEYLNSGDSEIYGIIDMSNADLYNGVREYLHGIHVEYEIKDIEEKGNECTIKTRISAEGIGWSASGFTIKTTAKLIDGKYKVTDTTLFDNVGTENIFKMVFIILAIVFGIIFVVFLTIVIVVVIVIKKSNKKKKENI